MASILKCKMCGGSMEFDSGTTVCECEYCGTKQTLPKIDDERRLSMFDRANYFRRQGEYDKAIGLYDQIISEDGSDAEAYWSLVLSRYGIDYVEDPRSHKRVPTINRASFDSILTDPDYKSALEHADEEQRKVYESEAKSIDNIQKGFIEISRKEDPFDVFICYKESDEIGERTEDSVIAYDLYKELVAEGYTTFFARVTLEDKLGSAYEPYIFGALNSAKVMVAIGTRKEYFESVWVKNEWSRYLDLIKRGEKKTLIPAFKGMDAYDLPEEFSYLQSQDMSKIGAMQDLVRGVQKILGVNNISDVSTKSKNTSDKNEDALVKRVFLFLEDGNWESASEYCEKILDISPECAEAYLGRLMIKNKVRNISELASVKELIDSDNDYQRALRYGGEVVKTQLEECNRKIKENLDEDRRQREYDEAQSFCNKGDFANAVEIYERIIDYKDSREKLEETRIKLEEQKAEQERVAEERRIKRAKEIALAKKYSVIAAGIVVLLLLVWTFIMPFILVKSAESALSKDQYEAARAKYYAVRKYGLMSDFMNSKYMYNEGVYLQQAEDLVAINDYDGAIAAYQNAGNEEIIPSMYYAKGEYLSSEGRFSEAVDAYISAKKYSDAADKVIESNYKAGMASLESEDAESAITFFTASGEYEDSEDKLIDSYNMLASEYEEENDYDNASEYYALANNTSKIKEVNYLAGKQAISNNDYKLAGEHFDESVGYKDGAEQAQKAWYTYASGQLSRDGKTPEECAELKDILKNLGEYEDSAELMNESIYQRGEALIDKGEYQTAANLFVDLGEYKDSTDKAHKTMNTYITKNRKRNDTYTFKFLTTLKDEGYEDTADIYKELYSWKVELFANSDADDTTSKKTSISKYDPVIFHYEVTGGPLSGGTKLKFRATFPDGGADSSTTDYTSSYGWVGWFGYENGLYNNASQGPTGTMTLKVYDENNNLIGEISIKITK